MYSQLALLFLGCGEAEHYWRNISTMVWMYNLAHLTGSRERERMPRLPPYLLDSAVYIQGGLPCLFNPP